MSFVRICCLCPIRFKCSPTSLKLSVTIQVPIPRRLRRLPSLFAADCMCSGLCSLRLHSPLHIQTTANRRRRRGVLNACDTSTYMLYSVSFDNSITMHHKSGVHVQF